MKNLKFKTKDYNFITFLIAIIGLVCTLLLLQKLILDKIFYWRYNYNTKLLLNFLENNPEFKLSEKISTIDDIDDIEIFDVDGVSVWVWKHRKCITISTPYCEDVIGLYNSKINKKLYTEMLKRK